MEVSVTQKDIDEEKKIDFDLVFSFSFLFCIWNFYRFSIKLVNSIGF